LLVWLNKRIAVFFFSYLRFAAQLFKCWLCFLRLTPGAVYAWGMGTNLQLGTGEEDDEWSPAKMTGKQLENREVLMASSGGQHTVLLVKDKQES